EPGVADAADDHAGTRRCHLGAGGAQGRDALAAHSTALDVPGDSRYSTAGRSSHLGPAANTEPAALDAGLHRHLAGSRLFGFAAVQLGGHCGRSEWIFAAATWPVAAARGRFLGAVVRSTTSGQRDTAAPRRRFRNRRADSRACRGPVAIENSSLDHEPVL